MSWREVVDAREDFVCAALESDRNISELCAIYGVSRKTAYKWMRRYEERGKEGLEDLSRKRRHQESTPEKIRDAVLAVRDEHAEWGGITIGGHLKNLGMRNVPCARTIDRILKRAGRVSNRPVTNVQAPQRNIPVPIHLHDMWSSDFKGWWLTKDKKPFAPFTLKECVSRLILKAESLRDCRAEAVKEAYCEVFRTHGLPLYMLSDNGVPFANNGFCGLTTLSIWWMKLGITPVRIPPGQPFRNGSHERMHKDMAAMVESNPAQNREEQQRALDKWVTTYNYIRPHHALNLATPAEVYKRSPRPFGPIKEFVYPESLIPLSVDCNGYLRWRRHRYYLSEAFAKETIALEPLLDSNFLVWFRDRKLATTTNGSFAKLIEVF